MSNHQVFDGLINLFSASIDQQQQQQRQQQDELWILLLLTIFLNYQKPNVSFFEKKIQNFNCLAQLFFHYYCRQIHM